MSFLGAAVAEVRTYGVRYLAARFIRRVADLIDPSEALRREDAEETLRELGWWVYDGQAWTSYRTMVRMALRRARDDASWSGALSDEREVVGGEVYGRRATA